MLFFDPFPCRDFPLKGEAALIKRTTKLESLVAQMNRSFLPCLGDLPAQ